MESPHAPDTDAVMCYRHPDREFAVGCQRCDRPICPDCMHSASVGHHCPECTKQGAQKVIRGASLQFRPVLTQAILGIIVVAFIAQGATSGGGFLRGPVVNEGILWGPGVAAGELWRIVTGGFLHSGLMHIGFNGYALWLFGQQLERGVGALKMGLIYAGGLFGGSAAVLAFNFDQPTLGASGAVLGLAGGMAGVLMARGANIFKTSLGGIFLMNLALPILVPRISFWGHAGGIVGGFLVGYAIAVLGDRSARATAGPYGHSPVAEPAPDLSVPVGAGIVVALGVLAVVIGTVIQGF